MSQKKNLKNGKKNVPDFVANKWKMIEKIGIFGFQNIIYKRENRLKTYFLGCTGRPSRLREFPRLLLIYLIK